MQRALLLLATSIGVLFLIGPLLIVVGGSVSDSPFVQFPPEGFTLRWYAAMMRREDFLVSFLDSVLIATFTTALAAVIGTLAALGIHLIGNPRLRETFSVFVLSPLVLPTIITGVALFQAVRWIDVDMPYVTLIVGHTLITIPYVVRTVGAALIGMDQSILEAAESLGAGPARVLAQVLVPTIAPAILVSLIFVFIVSFDQVTVSLFLTSPDVTPLPIRIYNYIEFAIDPMIAAVSTALIVFAYLLVVVLERLVGLNRVFGRGH